MSKILVINVGSSSCKVTIVGAEGPEEIDTGDESPMTWDAARWRELARHQGPAFEPDYVLHRFVHGGGVFHGPTVITGSTRAQLETVAPLAPLHTRNALAVVDVLAQVFSGAIAIACFDTTFHETLAPAAYTYAVPSEWREAHGMRKYGFHGFAHDYANARGRELVGARKVRRVLSCHLGSGSSLAAIVDGLSVDTTMGFTPVDGLVMATRPGSLDPGAIVWLLSTTSIDVATMSSALERSSGLTGIAGHDDMRIIMRDAEAGDLRSTLAYDVWLHRLVGKMGEMIATMGGVDLIVFGGGIGERAGRARADAVGSLAFLGLELDETANRAGGSDRLVSNSRSAVAVAAITAREDLAMIRRASATGLMVGVTDPSAH
ncbi:acetate/propionate family kinase [Lacisediminihabitans sp. FW035]